MRWKIFFVPLIVERLCYSAHKKNREILKSISLRIFIFKNKQIDKVQQIQEQDIQRICDEELNNRLISRQQVSKE